MLHGSACRNRAGFDVIYDPVLREMGAANGWMKRDGLVARYSVYQVNYSCNWDKLVREQYLDRTAIPLYYEMNKNTVNPFQSPEFVSLKANNLILRVRTPCLPCGKPDRLLNYCRQG